MAKLQDLKQDEAYVFTEEFREFLDNCDERSQYGPLLIKAAEKLTQSELEYLWLDAMGAFECSHSDYVSPSKELLERAGPLVWFFFGYGQALCELT